jgi:hypothetical protein
MPRLDFHDILYPKTAIKNWLKAVQAKAIGRVVYIKRRKMLNGS